MTLRQQSLVIHFVSHKDDSSKVSPLIDGLYSVFSRNPNFPFSSELNIPIFVWRSMDFAEKMLDGDRCGEKTVVFVFTSGRSCIDDAWTKGLNRINKKSRHIYVVPIALDNGGVAIPFRVGLNNVIPYFKFEKPREEMLAIFAVQAVCQQCYCRRGRNGLVDPLTVFLSHTKSDVVGGFVVKQLRDFICSETSLQKFIDINDIQSGECFDKRIVNAVGRSAFLAIVTDNYSTRRWCQLEAVEAKKKSVPIVVMNCVARSEDRILPALANVPCVRPVFNLDPQGAVIPRHEIVRVLKMLMVESLRCYYLRDVMSSGYPGDVVLIRPPESDITTLGVKSVIRYPDPPLLAEEEEHYFGHNRCMLTPSEGRCALKQRALSGLQVGMSVSNPEHEDLSACGMRIESLERLSQDVAQKVLSRGASLIYGGDFRPCQENGFAALILDEAKIVQKRLGTKKPLVRNFLAWPICHKRSDEEVELLSHYTGVVECVRCNKPPRDVCRKIGDRMDVFFSPNTAEQRYFWSRGLTAMREKTIALSNVRICAGGKFSNYSGQMPGVLEEVLIALRRSRPLYLIGGFGGVTSAIANTIRSGKLDERLTLVWQTSHSLGYSNLIEYSRTQKHPIDYSSVNALTNVTVKELAKHARLNAAEYERLMVSPYVDECVDLVSKGLSKLAARGCL